MRIRKKAWARPELEACSFFVQKPENYRGKWKQAFINHAPIYLELGCGKGVFAAEFGAKHKEINLLAIDIKSEILALAKREVERQYKNAHQPIDNVLLTAQNIEQIENILDKQDEVERIYIHFCNPWPRHKHQKRRLTYTRQLEKYKMFLKKDAKIYFKTDDENLFKDSLYYFQEAGFQILWQTEDLHSNLWEENIETEHEKMYLEKGITVKAIIAVYK